MCTRFCDAAPAVPSRSAQLALNVNAPTLPRDSHECPTNVLAVNRCRVGHRSERGLVDVRAGHCVGATSALVTPFVAMSALLSVLSLRSAPVSALFWMSLLLSSDPA